ncbi:dipeptide/oligopeptide/nickel ABC transporter ATP-binding protein [Streptomyces niveiscabiei]|uniref:dipeptide/oligopeptide/nickel ABC transporter ATP-binding protein n=1 Tax=Streptomyces niveiscabiei TaxID=164115 RepID=UPI0029AB803C|nr:dipeptide/oligopeptide/nickel ABC transporter ATP-binding protein [Streptomyces niveiscabiei]MDX3382238.1 dipeptide/oligopeptide/nickel ABC transporter ATP-binding protein [Streptomyces niveiscabiei]
MPRTEPDTRPEGGSGRARVENLHRHFVTGPPRNREILRAVDGVTFDVRAGECLAVVGESGSGKSTLARALTRLVEPTGGSVHYKGRDLPALSGREMRKERRNIQMVFQDPYASLHPRRLVGDVVREAWRVHKDVVPKTRQESRIAELLRQVGLPEGYAGLCPSRLSGGERQRVAIARALAQAGLRLHLPRPEPGPAGRRPGGRDAQGADGGDRDDPGVVRKPGTPLHPGAAQCLPPRPCHGR